MIADLKSLFREGPWAEVEQVLCRIESGTLEEENRAPPHAFICYGLGASCTDRSDYIQILVSPCMLYSGIPISLPSCRRGRSRSYM